MSVLSVDFGN